MLPAAHPLPSLPNGRLIPFGDGIVAMAQPAVADARELARLGVRRIISEVPLGAAKVAALEAQGIAIVQAHIGSTFRHTADILAAARAPGRLAIHCEHGVDRTGATLAVILHCVYDVPIGRAFLAVVNPDGVDQMNLTRLLADAGELPITHAEQSSIYSAAANGGRGGMKVRAGGFQGVGYFNLARTAIEAAQRC